MLLKYRGISYDYNPPEVEMEPSKIVGRYRGLEWRFRTPKSLNVQQPTLDLIYRGVAYQSGEAPPQVGFTPQVEPTVQPSLAQTKVPDFGPPVQDLARRLLMGHHKRVQNRQQAMLSRTNAEVGLDPNTSHYWSSIQGKVPSQNWSTYDRSAATLS